MVFLYTKHDVDYTLNDDLMMKMIGRDIIPPDKKKIIFFLIFNSYIIYR